ncbi:MAG: alpha/beta hydrolase [Chloroflexi bacterium]|nr:alpha/beta hydrolase [Chloroflexota bacterium]
MRKQHRRWLFFGIAAGVTAGATTLLIHYAIEARLALARRVGTITRRVIERLDVPAESHFVLVNGIKLHAVVAGPENGPLVVLLHGFPECWYSWRRQIVALVGAGYRVVVPDQRGYNLSEKPTSIQSYRIDQLTSDIRELVLAFGHERAIIVSHDWGGAVAWRLAMDYPDLVKKLVVMNAPHPVAFAREIGSGWSQRLKSWYMIFFQLPGLPEALLSLLPIASARFFFRRMAVRSDAFSNADLKVMATAMAQPGAMQTMLHWYRAAFRHPPSRRTQVIETPTLLIWAEDDVALGKSLTYGLEKWVPNLSVHYISNCGHWVQNEAPDEVNARLLDYVNQN